MFKPRLQKVWMVKPMYTYAPIIITTLNRFRHFKLCVESLSRCLGASLSDLFIAIDYPLHESQRDGHERIKEYSKTIQGFKSIRIIQRDINFGAEQNLKCVRELISSSYDRFIYVEDDCEFSPNFLDYINKGLVRYQDDPRIIAVCGDGGIFEKPSGYDANYLYRKGFSAWGYGTWFDRDYKVDYSVEELKCFILNKALSDMLKYYYEYHYYVVLSHIYRNLPLRGDGAVALDMIKNDTYCVYPTVSKVRNHGHDGSGEHGGNLKDNPFVRVVLDEDRSFEYFGEPCYNDERYVSLLRDYSKVTLSQKIRFYAKMFRSPKSLVEVLRTVFCNSAD